MVDIVVIVAIIVVIVIFFFSHFFFFSNSPYPLTPTAAVDSLCKTLAKESPGARYLRKVSGICTQKELTDEDPDAKNALKMRAVNKGLTLHPNMELVAKKVRGGGEMFKNSICWGVDGRGEFNLLIFFFFFFFSP